MPAAGGSQPAWIEPVAVGMFGESGHWHLPYDTGIGRDPAWSGLFYCRELIRRLQTCDAMAAAKASAEPGA